MIPLFSSLNTNRSQPLVLAVEDNEDNLLLLQYLVESFECRFIGHTSAKTALLLAQQHQPDLILTDILMPELDGTQLMLALRQNPLTRTVPIVAVTALARAEDRENLLQSGFTDYLSKPYMLDELEAMVRRHVSWWSPSPAVYPVPLDCSLEGA